MTHCTPGVNPVRENPTIGDQRNEQEEFMSIPRQRGIESALQRKEEQPLASAPSVNVKSQTDKIGSDLGYHEREVINVNGLVSRGGRCRPRCSSSSS